MELSSLYNKFEQHYEITDLHKFAIYEIQIRLEQNNRQKALEERNMVKNHYNKYVCKCH